MKIRNKKTGEIIEITNPKQLAKYGLSVPKAQGGLEIGEESDNPDNQYYTQLFDSKLHPYKGKGIQVDVESFGAEPLQNNIPLITPNPEQQTQQSSERRMYQANIQGSDSALSSITRGMQNAPMAIEEMRKGNINAMASMDVSPFMLSKAIGEGVATKKVNNRLRKQSVENFQDAQTLNFLNNYNDSQYGTTNIGMAEHGKLIQYQNGGRAPIKGTKEQYRWADSKGNYDVVNSENPNTTKFSLHKDKYIQGLVDELKKDTSISKLNKKYGNPEISAYTSLLSFGYDDAMYNPINNTISLNLNKKLNSLERFYLDNPEQLKSNIYHYGDEQMFNHYNRYLDELPHSSQRQKYGTLGFINKFIKNDLPLHIKTNFSDYPLIKDDPYSVSGTIENEAHKVIEPKIKKEWLEGYKNGGKIGGKEYFDKKTGKLMGTYEDGGIAKYKSMNQGGLANVLTENKEVGQLPSGLIDTMYGDNHSDPSGGIHMNLPEGSKIFSEKLKHPEKKKSFAKLAKKFETKKDFENLESPIADNINKFTADLNIKFKNKASDELFAEQENMKLNGVFGDKVKNNTMKDYEMKYGGLTKMDGESGANMTPFESTKDSRKKPSWWGDRTKLEEMMSNFEKTSGYNFPYYTPDYDVNKMAADYQKAVINKHPQIVTNLFKNKALPFTNKAVDLYKKQNKTKTTPNETELIKFYNKNPQLITEQFGDDLWGMRGFEMQDLPFNSPEEYAAWKQDKDWIPVGDNYFYDVSGENETPLVYKPKLNYSTQQKVKRPSEKLQIPASTPIEKGKYNTQGFKAIPVVQPFQEPYLESPVARFTFNPNLIDYRNQNPDFTEIDRQYQGAKTGDPRIDANLFAKTLNAKNQIAFGTQAQNRQGQMQVDQYNAGALDRLQQLQYGEDNTYRGLVNQMRGALNTQKLMDRSVAQSNAQKQMDYYNFALPTIETLYGVDPNEQYIKKGNPLSAHTTTPTKKYGGKIKPKFKKKSSK